MITFQILRSHALGLDPARRLARHWAEDAERKHQMVCTVTEGETRDRVSFERPGVRGELLAGAERFELTVTLGFLLSAFNQQIRGEIEKNLDEAIAQAAAADGVDPDAPSDC